MTLDARIHSIVDEALGNTSYLVVADERSAVVVDPRRDIDEYLAIAERLDLKIVGVLETHLHADFVGGARELADACGAMLYAAADARLGFAHTSIRAGDRLRFGEMVVDVLATPGHTPEHVSYVVTLDRARALFSGGSLISGGAARTDLTGSQRAEELPRAQFASLRALAELPDDTLLYPTHGAGSFCSTTASRSASGTIGEQRASNPLFASDDEETFVKQLMDGFGSYPRYFTYLRDVNRAGAQLLRELAPIERLDPTDAARAAARGSLLIDGRPWRSWAAAHAAGSISNEVRPAFASWLGWIVPFGAPFVLVLEPGQVEPATLLAHRIGYDAIEGWITFEDWRDAGLQTSDIATVSAQEASERAREGWVLLDVRQDAEFATSRIPGARHVELGDIVAGKAVDAQRVITYCGHGERSATAASFLIRHGIRTANLDGGIDAWRRAGLRVDA